MPLDPKIALKIHTARINGASADEVYQALVDTGVDADTAFKEYFTTPLPDGRLAGEVNLGDPNEWR